MINPKALEKFQTNTKHQSSNTIQMQQQIKVNSKSSMPLRSRKVNWNVTAKYALKITLEDYAGMLRFKEMGQLAKSFYQRETLLIEKPSMDSIPHPIASIFRDINLIESKGLYNQLCDEDYYKLIVQAQILMDSSPITAPLEHENISMTFLSHIPSKPLIDHLYSHRLQVETASNGVYHVINDAYDTQFIATSRLPLDTGLWLRGLSSFGQDPQVTELIINDFRKHKDNPLYISCISQLQYCGYRLDYAHSKYAEYIHRMLYDLQQELETNDIAKALANTNLHRGNN